MLARWPARIRGGQLSDQVWAFRDFLPTASELAGVRPPAGIDGISIAPVLLGRPQRRHEYLYWEFHERGFSQAVRMDDWKGVRLGLKSPVELHDLHSDPGEKNNHGLEGFSYLRTEHAATAAPRLRPYHPDRTRQVLQ